MQTDALTLPAGPARSLRPRFTVHRAAHLGMCFGVRDAIRLAMLHAQTQPLTVLGDLVHNPVVLADLLLRGVQLEHEIAAVATPTVMITAHGASERRIAAAGARGLRVLEATCPLVRLAHTAVQRLVRDGFHPVVIGKRDHVEVRGLTEDLDDVDVVLTMEDIRQLQERPRFGVVAQTTQPVDRVRALVAAMRERFPQAEVRLIDTVCQPTKQRQHAAVELAQQSDVVVVIGGVNSNNTRELVATCAQFCAHVHHVQNEHDLRPEWFADARTVGITAGTSTPDEQVDAVEAWLQACAAQA